MPALGYLYLSEKKNLQSAIKTEENPKVRERILMLLLLNDGKTYQEIAEFLAELPFSKNNESLNLG